MDRRELLSNVAAFGTMSYVVSALGGTVAEAQATPDTTRFFPGFKTFDVKTTGANIHGVVGGSGPPLLLLHGAPQTHVTWRLVAPQLATSYTVIVPDLRGYGDSSKPPDGESHVNYSKRAMALDQVEVMQKLGFDRFAVVGHDRGARVAWRMAVEHPDRVTRLAVLDIVPLPYSMVTREFATQYFHWFFLIQPAPFPETLIGNNSDFYLRSRFLRPTGGTAAGGQRDAISAAAYAEYLRCFRDPATIHASCEDYRAGATIDIEHSNQDAGRKVICPTLVLWGERGTVGRLYDVMKIWREHAVNVSGKSLPAGHFLPEEVPDETLRELLAFLGVA